MSTVPHRKIIHVDMDAFFTSVEQRDNPALKGKPIAVGGSSKRGVIAAASYEARKYGVRSAMPGAQAAKLCPHLIFVPHRFDAYREVSDQIREVFAEYTDLIEPLSLDEAFLDVTENKLQLKSAINIANQIRRKIEERTQLTASAGVSINKFLAKIASDVNKPNGLTVIMPDEVESFLEQLEIDKFFGVGKATSAKMKAMGIFTGADLKKYSMVELAERFGKFGRYIYNAVRGEDNRPVKANRIRKSISKETTYDTNLITYDSVKDALQNLTIQLHKSAAKRNILGRTINLKFRFGDFQTLTRSKTINHFTNDADLITKVSLELVEEIDFSEKGVRLLGVGLSNLNTELKANYQLVFNFPEGN